MKRLILVQFYVSIFLIAVQFIIKELYFKISLNLTGIMVITIPIFILTFTLNFIHINREYKKDLSVKKLIINYRKIIQPYIRCFVGAILVGLITMTTIGLHVLIGLNIISTAYCIGLLLSTFFLEQKLGIMIYSSVN